MLKKIKNIILTLTTASALMVPFTSLALVQVHAQGATPDAINTGLCDGVKAATGGTTCDEDATNPNGTVTSVIRKIINLFSLIVGAVSVIMIIYGGFKYITSGGNDGNVSGAKNTILYAVIGLIIVALAQVIVRFILTKANAA